MKIGQSNKIKNEIVSKIMDSQDLLKLLYYTNSDVDIYELADLTSKQKRGLMSSNIYRYKRIPANEDNESKTYLSFSYGENGYAVKNNKQFKKYTLNIWIVTRVELDDIVQGSRLDEVEDVLNEVFHTQDNNTLGDCEIKYSVDINPPSPYLGRAIVLTFIDFNHPILERDVR